MVIYNLDETPDVFITPNYYDDVFSYRMEQINDEDNRKKIRVIDLRSDKLMIYGTEVQESMFKRLYESLVIRPKGGIFYVNCNGACYVLVPGTVYRPIHNVIFDWSSFGIVVPNSVNDSLRKQLEEKEKALQNSNHQLELAKIEAESTKASLKVSNDEVFELKKVQNDLGLKLQKAYEKVALIDFELELHKIELESSKKESDEVLDELCNCKEEREKMKVESQKMHDQLSSEISSLSKRNSDLEMKSEMLEKELSSMRSTLHSTKNQLALSNKNAKELEEHLSSFKNKCRVMEEELNKVQEQLVVANKEGQHTATLLESSTKEVEELQDLIKCNEKEQQCMKVQLQKMINQIRLINMEVMASNQKLDQVLISSLWKELNNHSHHKISIQCTKCGHIAFVSYNELGMLPSSIEIDVHDISIL